MRDNHMLIPGLCPEQGCPEPTKVEGILVDKVYDSCFQMENLPPKQLCILAEQNKFAPGALIPCSSKEAVISCVEIERRPLNNGLFEIDILVKVENMMLHNPFNPSQTLPLDVTPFIKTLTMRCPEGTVVDCSESTVNRCLCTVAEVLPDSCECVDILNVICQIQLCMVVKCMAKVQLLIPSYGICQPAPCVTLPPPCPSSPPEQCF
jgi:hypothetical protein